MVQSVECGRARINCVLTLRGRIIALWGSRVRVCTTNEWQINSLDAEEYRIESGTRAQRVILAQEEVHCGVCLSAIRILLEKVLVARWVMKSTAVDLLGQRETSVTAPATYPSRVQYHTGRSMNQAAHCIVHERCVDIIGDILDPDSAIRHASSSLRVRARQHRRVERCPIPLATRSERVLINLVSRKGYLG